ncbi:hypothetical protein PAHAL_5G380100 [Panicum hallii]|uniref:Uncharacterized protein n=1 Tax=Panicum hallii TaxID=206008 RepID=A0A2S3HVP9_9POAL|nr:hypothetical protein PAHAL_5G380100 [Panicum hallii]
MDGCSPLGDVTNTCNRRKRQNPEGSNIQDNNHGVIAGEDLDKRELKRRRRQGRNMQAY